MIKHFALFYKKTDAVLDGTTARRVLLLTLFAINLVLIAWVLLNCYKLAEFKNKTLELQESNLETREAIQTRHANTLALEATIKKQLANRNDLNGLILSLESTAPAHNVTLSNGGQTYVEATREKLSHSLIQYSVQGSYADVLQFVAESLNKHDALVLCNLTFQRQDPLTSHLTIQLEWAFYLDKPQTESASLSVQSNHGVQPPKYGVNVGRQTWVPSGEDIFVVNPSPTHTPPKELNSEVWEPPTLAVTPKFQEAATPIVPPLPYSIMAKFQTEQQAFIYLKSGKETIPISEGALLGNGDYKIEHISDSTVAIRYLPMNHLHELSLSVLE